MSEVYVYIDQLLLEGSVFILIYQKWLFSISGVYVNKLRNIQDIIFRKTNLKLIRF